MRKLSANYIYTGKSVLKNGIVVVDDQGFIVEVIDTGGKLKEAQGIEFYGGVVIPGLVNAHCHLELSCLKDEIPQGKGLPDFLKTVMTRKQDSPEIVENAAQRADRWMRANGIVAVGDVMNTELAMNVKQQSKIKYHHFLETMGVSSFRSEQTFAWASEVYEKIKYSESCSIVPHAPYSVCKILLKKILAHSRSHSSIYTIHHQETQSENQLILHQKGELYEVLSSFGIDYSKFDLVETDSFRSIEPYLPTNQNILLVHNLFVDSSQILFANMTNLNLFWVLCPNSNLYLEQKLPNIYELQALGCKIALGTDSLASNTNLSIFEEMKTITKHFPQTGFQDLVTWACRNGAEALKMDSILGDFDTGKRPGVNLIEGFDFVKMGLTDKSIIKVLV